MQGNDGDDHDGDFRSPGYVRRLKRYEAAATVVATADGMDFYSPFGPLIGRSRLPAPLVDAVNRHLDAEIAAREVAGEQLGELTLAQQDVQRGGEASLASEVARRISAYLGVADDRSLTRVRFESFWMVRHFPGTFSPVHFHSADVSGVLYLKVPDHIANEAVEAQQSYVNARRAGYITFFIGGKQALSKSLISFRPEAGDLYLFPAWLLHAVEPFEGAGERRSLSFNAFVE
jgi:uncharacterized protein (TIGR02466 family)